MYIKRIKVDKKIKYFSHRNPIYHQTFYIMSKRNLIKKYFERIPAKEWDYNSFATYLKVIGYDNNYYIFRNYIRSLKEIITDDIGITDGYKKLTAKNLLISIGDEKQLEYKVLISFYQNIISINNDNDDILETVYLVSVISIILRTSDILMIGPDIGTPIKKSMFRLGGTIHGSLFLRVNPVFL